MTKLTLMRLVLGVKSSAWGNVAQEQCHDASEERGTYNAA